MKWKIFVIVIVIMSVRQVGANLGPFIDNTTSIASPPVDHGGRSFADSDAIHLHIWNDLNNAENSYPNVLHKVEPTSRSGTNYNDNDLIDTNSRNAYPLEQFKKSDRDLYSLLYNLVGQKNQNPLKWNPTIVNYVPNILKSNIYTYTFAPPTNTRPTLYDQYRHNARRIREYYTNIHKDKSKDMTNSGYKFMRSVMANEPTPQQYRTFQLYEPIPGQILLPPTQIPMFKPVPPPLKIIPVVDDYMEQRPYKVYRPVTPSTVIRFTTPQMYPFYAHEAVTKASLRPFIPVTEQYQWPHTEPYSRYRPATTTIASNVLTTASSTTTSSGIGATVQSFSTVPSVNRATYPSVVYAVTAAFNGNGFDDPQSPNYNTLEHDSRNEFGSDSHKNKFNGDSDVEYINKDEFDTMKLVSAEQLRPTYGKQHEQNQRRRQQQQHQQLNNNYVDQIRSHANTFQSNHKYTGQYTIRSKTNQTKQLNRYPNASGFTENVIKRNLTGFSVVSNTDLGRQRGKLTLNNNADASPEPVVYGKYQPKAPVQPPEDSSWAGTIQVSTAYSKNISNLSQDPMLRNSSRSDREKMFFDLANDINRILEPSKSNDSKKSSESDIRDVEMDDDDDDSDDNDSEDDDDDIMDHSPIIVDDLNEEENIKKLMQTDLALGTSNVDRSDQFINKDDNNSPNKEYATVNENDESALNANGDSNNQDKATRNDDKYYNWYSNYAAEKNRKYGRAVISEHFKKVEIEPNVAWVILPR